MRSTGDVDGEDNAGVLVIGGAWRTKSSNGGAIAKYFVAIDVPSQKQHSALPTKTMPYPLILTPKT